MKNTISVRIYIKLEDIKDLLDSGSKGSAYWCDNKLAYENETERAINSEITVWDIEADEKPTAYGLNLKKMKKGFTVMAKKYPKQFMDFITKNYDAETGDVFIQCCLFGDVIYG